MKLNVEVKFLEPSSSFESAKEHQENIDVRVNGKHPTFFKYCSRMIYKYEDILVKIDVCPGFNQCSEEAKIYKKIEPQDKIYFPNVLAYGIKWIAVEYHPATLGKRKECHREIIDKIIRKYKLTMDIEANCSYNWLVSKKTGLPLIYDWGCTANNF